MLKLPVLMYHNVSEGNGYSHGLTISQEKIEEQFRFLKDNGYTTYHLQELQGKQALPAKKNILITFDDVTENQLLYALPLLQKYNLKAVFFIPFAYLGKTDSWNKGGSERIMTAEQLKNIDSGLIELGFHSYLHYRFADLNDAGIAEDFEQSKRVIAENGLTVYPAIAYPYGNYPKKEPAKSHFKTQLEKHGMKMGFKIGNRLNRFPFREKYEIQRIDVKGQDSLFKFRLKLKFGRLKLF